MPESAQFIVLLGTDTPVSLPTSGDSTIDFNFDLDDLDHDRTVVVMFKASSAKLSATGQPRLKLTVNGGVSEIDLDMTDATWAQPRTWHEIVQKGKFKRVGNILVLEGPAAGTELWCALPMLSFSIMQSHRRRARLCDQSAVRRRCPRRRVAVHRLFEEVDDSPHPHPSNS